MASEQPTQPVKRFRVGNVTAAVWKNGGNMSVTLQKSYKVKDSEPAEWKNTDTLFHGDILNAGKALERAEAFIAENS
jgi:hypothetical protein